MSKTRTLSFTVSFPVIKILRIVGLSLLVLKLCGIDLTSWGVIFAILSVVVAYKAIFRMIRARLIRYAAARGVVMPRAA